MAFKDDQMLKAMLRVHEGVRPKLYKDTVGKWTIGVGRNLSDRPLSVDEMDYLLQNDIADVERQLRLALPWFADLDVVRQRVLIDMGFMGVPKLLQFKNTLAAVRDKRWNDAANGILASKYAKQVGYRAVDLADMMRSGVQKPFKA